LVLGQLLVVAILAVTSGCDRQDNDWGLYDPDLKLVSFPVDTIFLSEPASEHDLILTIGMVPDDTVFVTPVSRDTQLVFRPDSIFFAPVDDDWLKPRTITVQTIDDQVEEGIQEDDLSFVIRSADPAYDGQAFDVLIPVIITDNDLAAVAVSETLLTLVESDMGAVYESYRLVLQSQPVAPVTISATAVPAEPSLHMSPTEVTFDETNWDVPQEITLWIELDSIDFDYQSLDIQHTSDSVDPNYGPALVIDHLDLEIFDDTLPPTATIAVVGGSSTMVESSVVGLDLEVSIDRSSMVPVIVHLATVDGTANAGADFMGLDQDVTFLPGQPLTQSFTLVPMDDAVLEYAETFEVVITAVDAVVIGAQDRTEITITDDDIVTLTLTATDSDEDSGAADFEVSLAAPTQFPISFTFYTNDGTALEGQDYEDVFENFVLEPGETSHIIPVVLYADDVHEPDETFTGALINISANAVWTDPPVECTIVNDDPQNITFADIAHNEQDGNAVFTIELNRPYPSDVHLVVNTLVGDGLNGPTDEVDALAGSDFTPIASGAWTIAAGSTTSTFSVPVSNDLQAESLLEYFRLEITNANFPGFVGLIATCTLTDDHQPCVAATDVVVAEDGGSVTFTYELQNDVGVPVTSSADVLLQIDSMDQTATAGDDYEAVSNLYTIPNGQPSLDVTVNITDDPHDDDNETFVLLVSSPVNALGNCNAEPPFATIIDDEFPSINIESTQTRLNEGSTFSFNISLTTQRQTPTTFDLDLLSGSSGGDGIDYTFTQNGAHSIPPFTDFITFTVPFLDDQLAAEGDEDIEVTIDNANCALGVISLPATIVDAPELSITGDAVLEGEVAYFTVTASGASTADITFTIQYSSGTAITGVDFSDANTGPFTLTAGDTSLQVPVTTVAADGGDAAVEEYYLTIINPINATNSPFNSATGHITDGDPPTLTWDGTASAVEGDDILFTMNLNWASSAGVQFSVIFTDGTAARLGIDYDDTNAGPFTIPPGNLSYQVAVPTTVDGMPELAAEDFTITMASPVNALLGTPNFTTGYVLDGDQPELSFLADEGTVEGGTLTFTVQLDVVTPVPVSFDIEYDNGSTQGASDFDASNTGPFTIAGGNASTTVTVNTVNDGILEGVESFIIRIANPVNAVQGADFEASGTIVDND